MAKIYNEYDISINTIVAIIDKHSMRCNCNGLAAPVSIQGYYYKCLSCDKSYEGVNYDFSRLLSNCTELRNLSPTSNSQLDYFNQAIDILRTNSRTSVSAIQNNVLAKLWRKIKH